MTSHFRVGGTVNRCIKSLAIVEVRRQGIVVRYKVVARLEGGESRFVDCPTLEDAQAVLDERAAGAPQAQTGGG